MEIFGGESTVRKCCHIYFKYIQHLLVLWFPSLEATHQTGRYQRLIYNLSWIRINDQINQAAPKESIRFGQALHHLLYCIPKVHPELGLAYLGKVDLADAYMLIWVHLVDIISVEFLIPK